MTEDKNKQEREAFVLNCSIRDADDELHIECRMSDGQKGAFVKVAAEFPELANRVAAALSQPQAGGTLSEDQWIALAERHAKADWNAEKPDGYFEAIKAVCADFALLARSTADASNAATGQGLTPEELKAAKYLNEISGPGFMHRQHLAPINAFVQRLLAAPAAPAPAPAARPISDALFCDLKTDVEKANFFLSGRGYATGVISRAIQNDVAMAYQRCANYEAVVRQQSATSTDRDLKDWWHAPDGSLHYGDGEQDIPQAAIQHIPHAHKAPFDTVIASVDAPTPAVQADERELDLYDEIECDLPALFGRASTEGHEAGQALAAQLQAKMRKARQQSATPADAASEADKMDAARYRWLCSSGKEILTSRCDGGYRYAVSGEPTPPNWYATADEAIDAAMSNQAQKGGSDA